MHSGLESHAKHGPIATHPAGKETRDLAEQHSMTQVGYELNKHDATPHHGPPWPKACAARRSVHVHGARWRGPHTRTLCPTCACALHFRWTRRPHSQSLSCVFKLQQTACTGLPAGATCDRRKLARVYNSKQVFAVPCPVVPALAGAAAATQWPLDPIWLSPNPKQTRHLASYRQLQVQHAPIQKGDAVKLIGTPNHILV